MRTLRVSHEVIQRAIGQPPAAATPLALTPVEQRLSDCLEASGLNGWEINFLSGVQDSLALGWSLTPNQQDTLDRIWREKA